MNWLGTAAYQLHDEFDYTGRDKDKLSDVLDRFEAYFRPQHMMHAWYRIGTIFSDSCKTQSHFMYQLKDLGKQCEFTNSDEVVKFLFLIHNKHSEVKQELLKCVTKDTTLGQCWSMLVLLKVISNQSNCQNTLERHSLLSVPLMCMQLTKRKSNLSLDVMMSHQQGEIL